MIKLQAIVQALDSVKISALPALHAFSGADITGRFVERGRLLWLKVFKDADGKSITSLGRIGTTVPPTVDTMVAIERLICQLHHFGTKISNELRWLLFRKKQAQSERLPPSQVAIQQRHHESKLSGVGVEPQYCGKEVSWK